MGLPDSLVLSDPFASFSNLAIGQMVFDAAASALLGKKSGIDLWVFLIL